MIYEESNIKVDGDSIYIKNADSTIREYSVPNCGNVKLDEVVVTLPGSVDSCTINSHIVKYKVAANTSDLANEYADATSLKDFSELNINSSNNCIGIYLYINAKDTSDADMTSKYVKIRQYKISEDNPFPNDTIPVTVTDSADQPIADTSYYNSVKLNIVSGSKMTNYFTSLGIGCIKYGYKEESATDDTVTWIDVCNGNTTITFPDTLTSGKYNICLG